MKVDVIISAEHIREGELKGKNVVIIDMLRATSVIVTALNNGAEKVIPFVSIEEAFKYKKQHPNDIVLGGERKALRIDGFDLSNSPYDYTEDIIKGKTLILTTTNGTKAINASKEANNVFIGSILNADAVADKLCFMDEDITLVNAGTAGQFSMDDFICAGYIICCIKNHRNDIELTDIAKTADYIYNNNTNIDSFIKNAKHYGILKNLGLSKDLKYCMKKDIIDIIPEYRNGEIR